MRGSAEKINSDRSRRPARRTHGQISRRYILFHFLYSKHMRLDQQLGNANPDRFALNGRCPVLLRGGQSADRVCTPLSRDLNGESTSENRGRDEHFLQSQLVRNKTRTNHASYRLRNEETARKRRQALRPTPESPTTESKPGRRLVNKCAAEGCDTGASYALPSSPMTRYCYKHKLAGCVDVKNRKCMFPEGCKRRATYGSMLPLHADPSRSIKASQNLPDAPSTPEKSEGTHAPPRAAAAPRTDAASASNTSADARPRSSSASSSSDAAAAPVMRGRKSVAHFCALHRSPTDFRLFRKSCSSERGCSKIATFGLEQEGIARFCSKHKPPSYVDVRNPKCQAMVVGEAGGQPCGRRACFGDKRNPRATACSQHRQLMHVNLVKGRDD